MKNYVLSYNDLHYLSSINLEDTIENSRTMTLEENLQYSKYFPLMTFQNDLMQP